MAPHSGTYSLRERVTPRTPAVCLGQSPPSSALALLILVVLLGCAHTPPSPLTEAIQAQLGTIGVVVAPLPPEVDYRTPGRGGAGGAAIGTAKGMGLGVLAGVVCLLTGPSEACEVAWATPYLAVRYAVDQATVGIAADEIASGETAISAVLADRKHHASVRDQFYRLAAARTRQTLVPLPAEGTPSAAATTSYRQLAALGIDTVIEITLQRVALQSRTSGQGGGGNIWRISAVDLNPYLTLAVTARTRVLTTADGTALYEHSRDYIGKGATFTEWGANDAQLLREGLAQLLQEVAGEILTQVFGVALPPAPEPEAPTTPTPAQEPAAPVEPSANDVACPMCE